MQRRSHSRRLTSECLFVTACSMDEYAEKKTEKNLIVRSGISEAETTNNKRLRSTFCIEAIQTRSTSRPLCDSRASCHNLRDGGRRPPATMFTTYRLLQLQQQAYRLRIAISAYPTCIRRPRQGGFRRNIAIPFGTEKLEWCGCPKVKKFQRYLYSF